MLKLPRHPFTAQGLVSLLDDRLGGTALAPEILRARARRRDTAPIFATDPEGNWACFAEFRIEPPEVYFPIATQQTKRLDVCGWAYSITGTNSSARPVSFALFRGDGACLYALLTPAFPFIQSWNTGATCPIVLEAGDPCEVRFTFDQPVDAWFLAWGHL